MRDKYREFPDAEKPEVRVVSVKTMGFARPSDHVVELEINGNRAQICLPLPNTYEGGGKFYYKEGEEPMCGPIGLNLVYFGPHYL